MYRTSYIFKSWIATIVTGALLWISITAFYADSGIVDFIENLPIIFFLLWYGAIFSLPALGLLLLFYYWLKNKLLTPFQLRLIVVILSLIFIYITFYFFLGDHYVISRELLINSLIYSLPASFFGFYFPIEKDNDSKAVESKQLKAVN